MAEPIKPLCTGCNKTPDQIPEYVDEARESETTPDAYVRTEEGTYNSANGHFLFECVVWFNGWLAGVMDPYSGIIAAGEAANEGTFIAAIRARIEAEAAR